MSKILKWLKEEIISVIPAIVFFAIAFNLIVLTERLMLRNHLPGYLSYGLATLTALIVGKILIIINAFPFVNAFANKPLIYNILWKFFIYGSAVLLFRLIDNFIRMVFHHDSTPFISHHLSHMIESPIFWAIQVWLLMVFIVYIVSTEFTRVLGKNKIEKILFGGQID
jgi:hypothetical protein